MARYHFPGRRLLDGLLASVFVLPTVVVGAAVLALLPDSIDRGVAAILAAHVLFNLAVVVRTVGAVLATVPRDLEHAAATLGASPRRVFREITLPAITPALWASAAIVFVFTFTSFGVVRLLGGVEPVDDRGRDLAAGNPVRRRRCGSDADGVAARRGCRGGGGRVGDAAPEQPIPRAPSDEQPAAPGDTAAALVRVVDGRHDGGRGRRPRWLRWWSARCGSATGTAWRVAPSR